MKPHEEYAEKIVEALWHLDEYCEVERGYDFFIPYAIYVIEKQMETGKKYHGYFYRSINARGLTQKELHEKAIEYLKSK